MDDGAVAGDAGPEEYGYHEAHRDPGDAVRYPCGLTDSEWEQVRHIVDPPGKTGRPPKYPRRRMLDACIYVLRSGCSWRMLPKDFPPWDAVYRTFRRWLARDMFEAMYDELRKLWRSRERRDRDAAMPAVDLAMAKVPGLRMLYADGGYAGERAQEIRDRHGIEVEIVRHPGNRNVGLWNEAQLPLFNIPTGFVVLPKRWIIERTNAWNDRPRRMNKDNRILVTAQVAFGT